MRNIKSAFLALILVAVMASSLFAGAQDFVLVNRTGRDIYRVYISPSRSDSWEEDILGRDVLKDGDKATIRFSVGRTRYWDINIEHDNGRTFSWSHIDLINARRITLRRDGAAVIRR